MYGINCTSFKQLVNQGYLQQNIYNLLDWIKVWDYGHLLWKPWRHSHLLHGGVVSRKWPNREIQPQKDETSWFSFHIWISATNFPPSEAPDMRMHCTRTGNIAFPRWCICVIFSVYLYLYLCIYSPRYEDALHQNWQHCFSKSRVVITWLQITAQGNGMSRYHHAWHWPPCSFFSPFHFYTRASRARLGNLKRNLRARLGIDKKLNSQPDLLSAYQYPSSNF